MPTKEIGEKIAASWMDSSKHRHNILDDDFTRIGVGVVFSTNGTLAYTTQNFC